MSVSASRPDKTKSKYFPVPTSPSRTMSQTAPQISAREREESIEAISLVAVSSETSSKRIFA